MSLEIPPYSEPPVEAIRVALLSLRTDIRSLRDAPEHPYRQPIIDRAERAKKEIEEWLEGVE
jgi:hypothetical protein